MESCAIRLMGDDEEEEEEDAVADAWYHLTGLEKELLMSLLELELWLQLQENEEEEELVRRSISSQDVFEVG